jgi:hypothetical protein
VGDVCVLEDGKLALTSSHAAPSKAIDKGAKKGAKGSKKGQKWYPDGVTPHVTESLIKSLKL